MRRLFVLLLFLMVSVNAFAISNYINNAIDGSGRTIGLNIDTRAADVSPNATYKSYEIDNGNGTATTSTTIDVYTDLGRYCSGGFFLNDSALTIPIKISVDGTNYGNTINVRAAEMVDLTFCPIFKKIKMNPSATANFRLLVK